MRSGLRQARLRRMSCGPILRYSRACASANRVYATAIPVLLRELQRVGRCVGQLERIGPARRRGLDADLDRAPLLQRVRIAGVVADQIVVTGVIVDTLQRVQVVVRADGGEAARQLG